MKEDSTLIQLRSICYISVKFVLLFRHSEISELKTSHTSELQDESSFKIFIPKSKLKVFRDKDYRYFFDTKDVYPMVNILKTFRHKSGICIGDDQFIFTPLTFCPRTGSYKCTQIGL